MNSESLYFLPLGGSGEIGMNLNLYHTQGKWLMVDLGVTFDDTPGIEVVMPDTAFIEEHRKDLLGLVLTHAHEDHLGAVPYLWERLRCPIYATPFTAALLKFKCKEARINPPVHIIPLSGSVDIGPFSIDFIRLTHSIPEPNALAIRTPAGLIVHTGDWKLDPEPLIGEPTDIDALKALGDEGVLALVCDSTNVFVEGRSGSEGMARRELIEVVKNHPKGRVIVACFASNVARVASCMEAAKSSGRQAVLMGRSLDRVDFAARQSRYFDDYPPSLSAEDAATLDPDKTLIICTGSQGESRAALARIARGDDRHVKLQPGDLVIFSSRQIPGNEASIAQIQNSLTLQGVKIITSDDADIHVSGHPYRDELRDMYSWVKPHIVVPVHGEARHINAQALLAQECGVKHVIRPQNGDLIELSAKGAHKIDEVYAGRLALDGNRIIPFWGEVMRERHRIMANGQAVVTLVMDDKNRLMTSIDVCLLGIDEGEALDALADVCIDSAHDVFDSLSAHDRGKEDKVEDCVRVAVRRVLNFEMGKKPPVDVRILRV